MVAKRRLAFCSEIQLRFAEHSACQDSWPVLPPKAKPSDPLPSSESPAFEVQAPTDAPSPFAQGHSERLLCALRHHVQRLLQLCKGSLMAFLLQSKWDERWLLTLCRDFVAEWTCWVMSSNSSQHYSFLENTFLMAWKREDAGLASLLSCILNT